MVPEERPRRWQQDHIHMLRGPIRAHRRVNRNPANFILRFKAGETPGVCTFALVPPVSTQEAIALVFRPYLVLVLERLCFFFFNDVGSPITILRKIVQVHIIEVHQTTTRSLSLIKPVQ